MNSADRLVNLLVFAQKRNGKSEEKAKENALEYLQAFVGRLAETDKGIDSQLQRRIETIKKLQKIND
jgi:predicted RNase H-like HicB family nuclease